MTSNMAHVSEIFESIQGEGIYVGQRQVFLRLIGCNMSCEYCDTPSSWAVPGQDKDNICTLKIKHETKKLPNPVGLDEVLSSVNAIISGGDLFHSLSITGGEPLLQVDFLKELLPKIKIKKYLETNATMPDRLEEIIDLVDIVSMDFKLPSATKCGPYYHEHMKCLKTSLKKDVFVKAVFSKDTTAKEIDEMSRLIAEIEPEVPLVLQPATASRNFKSSPTPDQCLSFQAIAKRKLANVLVIPQVHKILGLQ